jgi:hypothetical protein
MEIEGYNNYLIYETGDVFNNKKNRFLKPSKMKNGYIKVELCKNGKQKTFKIHRLVAEYYIPNPENKPEVNHIDGDKCNNSVENLEWNTRKENMNSFQILKTNNTSGIKNISYHKTNNSYLYKKTIYGKKHRKYFKTFEEACEYKREYELNL